MLDDIKEKVKESLKGLEELKYKYVKRTGSPGSYQYWYKNPKTGKLEAGKKPSKEGGKKEGKLSEEELDEYSSLASAEGHMWAGVPKEKRKKLAEKLSEYEKRADKVGQDLSDYV